MRYLTKIKNDLNLRKLFINFSFRSTANLFSRLIGLITLPIIARAFGPETYGKFNLIELIITYTALPISLVGLRIYGIREIASGRKEKSYTNNILSMQFSIAAIAILISNIICYLIFKNNVLFLIGIFLSNIRVFANAFDIEFFFVSQKNLILPTIANITGQIFYLAGVIFFINNPDDFPILVLLSSINLVISDLILLIKFHKTYATLKIKFVFSEIIKTFKRTYQLGIVQNLEGFVPTVPQILLPVLISSYALGVLAGGLKVYSIFLMFYTTLFMALAPYLVQINNYETKTKTKYHLVILITIFTISSLLGILFYFIGEPIIILLLGKGFGDSVIIFKIISITLVPLTPIGILLGSILIYSGHEKYYLIGLIGNAIITIITSYFFIKYMGVMGSVYVMILSIVVSIMILSYFYFKTMKD